MNTFTLIGRLTKKPEKNTYGQTVCARYTLAVTRDKDHTDFLQITSFGKTADLVEKYLDKGSQVAVTGMIRQNDYEKDGQKVFSISLIGNTVEFIGNKQKTEKEKALEGFDEIEDINIPF